MGYESIELHFALPDSLMFGERDFLFVTAGHYVEEGGPPGFEMLSSLPRTFQLLAGYPNPFKSEHTIQYAIPRKAKVRVAVYDVAGRLVGVVIDDKVDPGYYQTNWKGEDSRGRSLPSGTYFIRMESKEFRSTRKVVLMR
jgi:hypothetical protein